MARPGPRTPAARPASRLRWPRAPTISPPPPPTPPATPTAPAHRPSPATTSGRPPRPTLFPYPTPFGSSGSSNTDNLTNKPSVQINVAAEAGSLVALSDGQTGTADASGQASFTVALAEGANNFTATATDAAGNTDRASTPPITRDHIRPPTATYPLPLPDALRI